MLPAECKILKHLRDNGGKCPIAYLRSLSDDEKTAAMNMGSAPKEWISLADGVKNRYGEEQDFKSIVITDAGKWALLQEENRLSELRKQAEQKAAEEAKKEKNRLEDIRRSWWQFGLRLLFDILLFLSGWVLGGFTFFEFVETVKGLFR